jgi:hypothetical protein
MDRIPLQIPAIMSGHRTLSNSLRISFDTCENVKTENLVKMLSCKDKQGWLLFMVSEKIMSAEEIVNLELPEIKTPKDEISPSKRLKNRMFVYYEKTHGTKEGFETWYVDALNKLGQKYLDSVRI